MKRLARPRSLTELVADQLRREIISGELAFGQALSEALIAQKLEVSRTPVREAFARLELEGLVRSEPQRGTFVFTVSMAELSAICDVRVVLETGGLRLACEHDRASLAAALGRVVAKMAAAREAGDDRGYLGLDAAFHQALIDGAGNAYLAQAYQTIAPRMAALRNRLGDHPDHMAKSFDEHRRITALIAEGDAAEAEAVLIAHIGRKEGSYWSLSSTATERAPAARTRTARKGQ